MPPKRRRSSINPVTAPLPTTVAVAAASASPSKIPRRKSGVGAATVRDSIPTTSTTTTRRRSSLPAPRDKITPRSSLAEDEIPKETPYNALKQLANSLASRGPLSAQPAQTPRRVPQTPARRTPAVSRTPGTVRRTPRAGTAATPHTARAVKQLQLQTTVGRSGGVRKRTEIRRESQRDVLRGLSRALATEVPTEGTTRLNDVPRESSDSPPPPELESRLSTPSSDDLPAPRLSLGHDPLAPTKTLARTPPSAAKDDDTVQSIENIRRAPLNRLSDRLSFGAEDVDDTMMDILANRPEPIDDGGFADESLEFGEAPMEDDDTGDFRQPVEEGEGEFTAALNRVSPEPELLDLPLKQPKPFKAPTFRPQKVSRHGTALPNLPRELLRSLAQQFSSRPITKDVLPQLERATDEFFKNLSSDLATFASHAGRKTIEEHDVQILLARQRMVKLAGAKESVFSVARKYLPGELLGRVRMVKSGVVKKRRGARKKAAEVAEEE